MIGMTCCQCLRSGYAGYALDLLGHGESYKPADYSEYTFDAVFDHFSAWIDSLQITEPMILVGHSLGGGVVFASMRFVILSVCVRLCWLTRFMMFTNFASHPDLH